MKTNTFIAALAAALAAAPTPAASAPKASAPAASAAPTSTNSVLAALHSLSREEFMMQRDQFIETLDPTLTREEMQRIADSRNDAGKWFIESWLYDVE